VSINVKLKIMEDLNEDTEPKIDCKNTDCDECWYNEWCNTYQDARFDEMWEDCDDNDEDNNE